VFASAIVQFDIWHSALWLSAAFAYLRVFRSAPWDLSLAFCNKQIDLKLSVWLSRGPAKLDSAVQRRLLSINIR